MCALSAQVLGQNQIDIPCSDAPNIDGNFNGLEWRDADEVSISIQGGNNEIDVLFMRDSLNLCFAFLGHLQSSFVRFPEILIDVNNDQTDNWDDNDWWFHVSATDCEFRGTYGKYDSCMEVRNIWTGIPNMVMGGPQVDTIEISIPLELLSLSQNDTFGIAFVVTNTATIWELWPAGADIHTPSGWATAVITSCGPSGIQKPFNDPLEVFPNPASDLLTVQTPDFLDIDEVSMTVVDDLGRSFQLPMSSALGTITINTSTLKPGFYHFTIVGANQNLCTPFVIMR